MNPTDFTTNAPGRIMRVRDANRENPTGHYYAFIPHPLPSKVSLDDEAIFLLTKAQQSLSELAGVGRQLLNPYLLVNPFLRREAILSSRIEGTIADAEQLLLFEADSDRQPTPDVEEVFNYVRAMQSALSELEQTNVSLNLIRRAHGILLQGVRGQNKSPGEFRREQNYVGQTRQRIWEARFVPPPPTEMQWALHELERYIWNPPEKMPVLIQLALIHYQFEAIHPFLDGNGRMGRMLITLLLCERQLLPGPLLYLSAYFEQHRDAYMDHLLWISQRGAWEEWLCFFLTGVAEQSLDALQRAQQLQDVQRDYHTRIRTQRAAGSAAQLVDELFVTPSITISEAAERLGIAYHTARLAIERLVTEGILREGTGRQRNKIYIAPEIMAIISD